VPYSNLDHNNFSSARDDTVNNCKAILNDIKDLTNYNSNLAKSLLDCLHNLSRNQETIFHDSNTGQQLKISLPNFSDYLILKIKHKRFLNIFLRNSKISAKEKKSKILSFGNG
jgi:hypothetical protein